MEKKINEVIEEKIRPFLQADGGDVELVSVDEDTGIVLVRLRGACAGCPGAMITLKHGIERILMEEVPGVTSVDAAPFD